MNNNYRYLLFSYDTFYPSGGANDFDFGFNKVDEIDFENEFYISDNVSILDLETFEKYHLDVFNNTPISKNNYVAYDEEKKKVVKKWMEETFR
jgi:hypothetical protein